MRSTWGEVFHWAGAPTGDIVYLLEFLVISDLILMPENENNPSIGVEINCSLLPFHTMH